MTTTRATKSETGTPPEGEIRKRLGRGRSGEVWRVARGGETYAVKVFYGDTLANLIHYVTTGAPNAYIWNEHAVRAAHERREIVAALLPLWFGREMGIAQACGVSFDETARVFVLTTRYVPGGYVPLLHPFRPHDGAMPRLRDHLMPRLQEKLEEAGLDGLVWQAGRGNPVALNNFLMSAEEPGRFMLVDAESGVPALFAVTPGALFGFYLRKALAYGRPLFDDVEIPRLAAYLDAEEEALTERLGTEGLAQLRARVARLDAHQRAWKETTRHDRAIDYQRVKGRLTPEEAEHYRTHRLAWRLRETRRAARKLALGLAVKLPRLLWRGLRAIRPGAGLRRLRRFVGSQSYRTKIGEGYVRDRIGEWRKRGQMSEADARRLLRDLASLRERSSYITDFGSHLGMKASFLVLEIVVLGGLSLLGVPLVLLALAFAIDGPIYRTVYTLYRSSVAASRGQRPPFVALLVGLVPLFGSLAYPAQMLWSAGGERDDVARFVVVDTLTRTGARIPLLGGRDTATEHAFNRLAARLLRLSSRSAGTPTPTPDR